MSRGDVLKRINTQMPLSEKIQRANVVIDNSGSLEATQNQVEGLLKPYISITNQT